MSNLRVSRLPSALGGVGIYSAAGAPSNGTNAIQTLTFGGTGAGAKFKLRFKNQLTAQISWSATNNTLRDNVDAALEALSGIGVGGVTTAVGTMTAGIGTLTVAFTTLNAAEVVPVMTAEGITGALTLTIAITTPGVEATARGAKPGAFYIDTTAGTFYQNTGTPNQPTWTGGVTPAQKNQVYNAFGSVAFDRAIKIWKVPLAAVDTGGGIFAWQNPEAVAVNVVRVDIDVTTQSSGACSIDVGMTPTNATTQADNLIDGLSVAAAGLFSTLSQAGANGVPPQKVAVGKWITGSKDSGASLGLVGFAYVHGYLA